jgi:Family of unknown function (DUF5681)
MGEDYRVGYGKPPSQHQFKKGKSGNPSGLRKVKRLLKKPLLNPTKLLISELKSPITIKENGKKKKVTKMEAIWKSIVADTIKGDKTARKYVMDFMMKQSEYAFEDDRITYYRVDTKAIDALLEEYGPYEIKEDFNQDEDNGPPSV